MRTAIVLAAGDATRLPNKVLLPVRPDYRPAVCDAIIWARETGAEEVIVVVNPSNHKIIKKIITHFIGKVKYVLQPSAAGVIDATQRTLPLWDDRALVLYGDNVYWGMPHFDQWMSTATFAAVQRIDNPQLDGYNEHGRKHKWVSRSEKSELKIAGWLWLRHEDLERDWGDANTVEFLNAIEAGATVVKSDTNMWSDIGTVVSYEEHICR